MFGVLLKLKYFGICMCCAVCSFVSVLSRGAQVGCHVVGSARFLLVVCLLWAPSCRAALRIYNGRAGFVFLIRCSFNELCVASVRLLSW